MNNGATVWLGADNKEEVIKALIDSIHKSVKEDMQRTITKYFGGLKYLRFERRHLSIIHKFI